MGRSYEYKSDPANLYIGDLKVPKKYITITTGPSDITLLEKTRLSIRFDSICTTTVNGIVYKLPTRESEPITNDFSDEKLVLKVNANKSDRIQLHLLWLPVLVLAFTKRILFEGQVQPSPLPDILTDLHSQGFDIKTVHDPLLATHYLTMSSFVDYNLQIAVLRGIPVVSTKWTDFIKNNADDVDAWLLNILQKLLLPGSENNFVLPNTRRPLLMVGINTLICFQGLPQKKVHGLKNWLRCLGSDQVVTVEVSNNLENAAKSILHQFESGSIYVFSCMNDDSRCTQLFGSNFNTAAELWKAVIEVDLVSLKLFDCENLVNKIGPVIEEEPESRILTQRRKRRRVERVNETDFFLFSQGVPSSEPVSESLEIAELPSLVEFELQAKARNKEYGKVVESLETQQRDASLEEINLREGVQASKSYSAEKLKTPEANETSTSDQEKQRKEEIMAATKNEEPKLKKPKKKVVSDWIVPQISLAEAVRSTKKKADDEVKKELGFDEIDAHMDKLVIVEEVDLSRKATLRLSQSTPAYKGRKNFKAFKKKGHLTHNVTRTFLELQDDTSANEIHFADLQVAPSVQHVEERIQQDFASEMNSVKGYQPQASQLFVGEVSSEEDDGETSFSFLNKGQKPIRAKHAQSDDDDDEFAFKFSRA